MSIISAFKRLFSAKPEKPTKRKAALRKPDPQYDFRLVGSKGKGVKLAGTSNYQPDIMRHAGNLGEYGADKAIRVLLKEEPQNAHDKNAVMVSIEDALVGYLPKADAATYKSQVAEAGVPGKTGEASARIIGGFPTDEGQAHLGIKLMCDWPLNIKPRKGSKS